MTEITPRSRWAFPGYKTPGFAVPAKAANTCISTERPPAAMVPHQVPGCLNMCPYFKEFKAGMYLFFYPRLPTAQIYLIGTKPNRPSSIWHAGTLDSFSSAFPPQAPAIARFDPSRPSGLVYYSFCISSSFRAARTSAGAA